MKITAVHIYSIKLPLKKPFIITYESYYEMPSVIIKLETDNGLTGYGEAVPDQHVTGETWESTISVLQHYLARVVIGMDPFHIEAVHREMDKTVYGVPAAKAAIDIACYDLMGKAAGQPVFNLLGGKTNKTLEVPHVLSILSASEMAEEARAAVSEGYDIIKIKVGLDWKLDIERINRVREAVGPDVRLRVDANQGWPRLGDILNVLEGVRGARIDWLEQPGKMDDIDLHAEVRRHSAVPVMIDEGVHGSKELLRIIQLKAADMINIKLMKCGGIFPALKLVYQAELAGISCQIGSMVESAIATSAGAHLSTAKRNIHSNEMVGPLMFSKDVGSLTYGSGTLRIPEEPGLGIEVNEKVLAELKESYDVIKG